MYTIGNNNQSMSVKLSNKIWTLGQYNKESGYNSCEKWSIFDIPSQEMDYIDIPKNIGLGDNQPGFRTSPLLTLYIKYGIVKFWRKHEKYYFFNDYCICYLWMCFNEKTEFY